MTFENRVVLARCVALVGALWHNKQYGYGDSEQVISISREFSKYLLNG